MMMLRYRPWRVGWTMSLVASLCMTLIPWLGHGAQGHAAESQRDITVHQGRLSVHLQDADVGDVLTVIGQQANITIFADLRPGIRVSTHFTGMALEGGLRRLLQLASLSYSLVYVRDPTGTVVLTAVHVFEEAKGQLPRSQMAADPSAEDRREEAGQSFAEALAQLSRALPPPPEMAEHDGAERFRALLESAQHHAPSLRAGEESDLARHFREVLEQTLQSSDETSPRDLPQLEYRE